MPISSSTNYLDTISVGHFFKSMQLITAAKQGDADSVRQLIEQGASVKFLSLTGRSAIRAAAKSGHLAVVDILLLYGADVDSGLSPSFFQGASPTPIREAVRKGHADVARRLLKAGATVCFKDDKPLLYYAVVRQDAALVDLLLEHGAPQEVDISSCDVNCGPMTVKQKVKELLASRNPQMCGQCGEIGLGVSRDYVYIKKEAFWAPTTGSGQIYFKRDVDRDRFYSRNVRHLGLRSGNSCLLETYQLVALQPFFLCCRCQEVPRSEPTLSREVAIDQELRSLASREFNGLAQAVGKDSDGWSIEILTWSAIEWYDHVFTLWRKLLRDSSPLGRDWSFNGTYTQDSALRSETLLRYPDQLDEPARQ